ncbi:caspase, EACC1-associated type [Streptomyces sp. NRRL S-350]|uniref:caspase, EACC1-associated type n=1 Tax=Streptomyces sp. NRRL S-350 TaxID=1463902 RepID=UPI000691D376|nr:tetratricopeptide repeat protein [Streptomyces sp. NRRL S-350]
MYRLPDASRSWAVLIGTARYSHQDGPADVPSIENNVHDFRDVLIDGQPGAFAPERSMTVLDPRQPRDLGLPLLKAAAAAEDVLLVYYSGHGLIGSKKGELYLALTETDLSMPSLTACPLDVIREAFQASPARVRVLILDCCFSGRAVAGGLSGSPPPVAEQLEIAGAYTLVSSPPNSPSHFEEGKRHTAFTGELLRALRNGVEGAGPEGVSLGVLFPHLRLALRSRGWPEPEQCGTDTAAYLILSRPRTRRPTRVGREEPARTDQGPATERERFHALVEAGRQLGRGGHARSAASELGTVLDRMTQVLGSDDPDTLAGRIEYAQWLGAAGQVREALDLSTAAVGALTRVLGADNRVTLVGRAQLAHWTGEAGQPGEAVRLTGEVVTDLTRALGPDDRETLLGRGRLAHWIGVSGDTGSAAQLTDLLVTDLHRVLGAEDRDTLVGRINQAQWSGRAGRTRQAVRLLDSLVPDLYWLLGADDLHTLIGRARLGQWTGLSGSPKGARGLFAAVVPDLSRVAGRDARETLLARSQYAHWTGEAGDPRTAIALCRQLLDDLDWILGEEDQVTLVNRARLAHWTGADGDVRTALRIFHEVLPQLRRALGPDHPEVRANEALLARWRRRADRRLRPEILFGRGHRTTDRRGLGKWSDG